MPLPLLFAVPEESLPETLPRAHESWSSALAVCTYQVLSVRKIGVFVDIRCDVCSKTGFANRRYKCLICEDYDQCGKCHDLNLVTSPHSRNHPTQCVLTPFSRTIYYGGNASGLERAISAVTCPYCGDSGLEEGEFLMHLETKHVDPSENAIHVWCPLCISERTAAQRSRTNDLIEHILHEHGTANETWSADSGRLPRPFTYNHNQQSANRITPQRSRGRFINHHGGSLETTLTQEVLQPAAALSSTHRVRFGAMTDRQDANVSGQLIRLPYHPGVPYHRERHTTPVSSSAVMPTARSSAVVRITAAEGSRLLGTFHPRHPVPGAENTPHRSLHSSRPRGGWSEAKPTRHPKSALLSIPPTGPPEVDSPISGGSTSDQSDHAKCRFEPLLDSMLSRPCYTKTTKGGVITSEKAERIIFLREVLLASLSAEYTNSACGLITT